MSFCTHHLNFILLNLLYCVKGIEQLSNLIMKYQSVLQHSEEDCGAASLATVSKHYGRTFALNRVREAVGTGSRGTTLLGLRRGAETLGFHARQVQATAQLLEKLNEVPLPAIIHWKG
jgi:ABC-type bacteriocin/lantibiotic exporter with double-glycine peptidase domain